ncbi:RloB family protein [Nocardia tengchongensis]|uniref:RloB family protein n=1 Tax=Nocardia tengchongensis TaxID=2055889 RepID=UPI00369AD168
MSARNNNRRKGFQGRRGTAEDSRPLERRPGQDPSVRVVYVGCEGEQTEPEYLDYLNDEFGSGAPGRPPFQLHPVRKVNGLKPSRAVAQVKEMAESHEAWVLFDRDSHPDIPQALRAAAEARIEVGFSHPSFDLWLLLHFQAFGGTQNGSSDTVVDKLRSSKATDAFRDYARRDKGIGPDRRKALRRKEQDAVDHARALVKQCEHGDCRAGAAKWDFVSRAGDDTRIPWQQWSARSGHAEHCPVLGRDPSTDVWRLLVSLGIATAG